jgi:hypothetical protein
MNSATIVGAEDASLSVAECHRGTKAARTPPQSILAPPYTTIENSIAAKNELPPGSSFSPTLSTAVKVVYCPCGQTTTVNPASSSS